MTFTEGVFGNGFSTLRESLRPGELYALYGLTPEEIKIVEDSAKK